MTSILSWILEAATSPQTLVHERLLTGRVESTRIGISFWYIWLFFGLFNVTSCLSLRHTTKMG